MTRKPRPWRPTGTEPPALFGSRDAPTTAIVFAFCRTSCELRATKSASPRCGLIFQVLGDACCELSVREPLDQPETKVDAAGHAARCDDVSVVDDSVLHENRATRFEVVPRAVMRSRAPVPQHARGGENHRAGADRGENGAPRRGLLDHRQPAPALHFRVGTDRGAVVPASTGKDQDLRIVAESAVRFQHETVAATN